MIPIHPPGLRDIEEICKQGESALANRIMTKPYRLLQVVAVSVGVVSALDLSGCKAPSSDVLKLGPDTYRISTNAPPVRGGSVEAKRIALSQATEICANSGKEAFVTNFKTSQNNAEVYFRCADRPKLKQP